MGHTYICVCVGCASCLCCCGSTGRRNLGDRDEAVFYTVPSCSETEHRWCLRARKTEGESGGGGGERGRSRETERGHLKLIFPAPRVCVRACVCLVCVPCHRGSSLRIFSMRAVLAACPDWLSPPPPPPPPSPGPEAPESNTCTSLQKETHTHALSRVRILNRTHYNAKHSLTI